MADLPPNVLRPDTGALRIQLHQAAPSPALDPVIAYLWAVEWDLPPGEVQHAEVLTQPCLHLTTNPEGVRVTGVVTRTFHREVVGAGRVIGAAFHPGGFAAFTDEAPSSLVDRRVVAHEVVRGLHPGSFDAVYAAPDVASGFAEYDRVVAALPRVEQPDAALVDDAVAAITADHALTRVAAVAARVGVTARTLQRRFDRYLGVGPKWVIQRSRIHEALRRLDGGEQVDWAALADRLGFADQAHFVNAFTAMIGVPPERYRRRG